MSTEPFNFSALLQPLDVDGFLGEHWERKPLHLQRGDARHYERLLSLQDLEHIVCRADARYPAVRLARDGGFFPPEAYTRNVKYGDESFSGVPDVERIFSEYLAGATVTLPALHRTWEPLETLCLQIESRLDHSVHTNAYLTPANTAGFTAHYDTHEVFVLQIAGSKRWRIYPPPLELPHRSQTFSAASYALPAAPMLELELQAGDLLYLPRGHVHAAHTAASFSAHITIGITVYTGVELATELLQSCLRLRRWRRALPPGFASRPELRQALKDDIAALLRDLAAGDADAVLDAFTHRVRAAQPRRPAPFRADVWAIGPRTALSVTARQPHGISPHGDGAVLEFAGRQVLLPAAARPALEAMRTADSFAPETLPGPLGLAAKLALVRHLHGMGFLEPARA